MFKRIITNPFFVFPVLTCIVFWPLTFQLFTLKNDALTYYYPVRTLISDALRNHQLPLWTPYINMGYPLHADMQSGAWSPVIWLFSFVTNYSLAAFHYELLFYFCFAGIGFYYLCREFGWSRSTAFTIGIAYELSGFMIDSVQFSVCISAACYLPYIFIFFKRLIKSQQVKDAVLTALFLYLLFTGGYPSLFIITCYFLLAYAIFKFYAIENKKDYLKKSVLPLTLVCGVFILLSLPAIISFIQMLPYINRGKTQSLDFVLENSMPPVSMFSLVSPFSTTAKSAWLNTDPLMRNAYIGIIPLLFLVYGIFNKTIRKNKEVKFLFITALAMFGLALGSHFILRQPAYYVLPLMNTFRHPALFRLFGAFCFLLIAGFSMNAFQKKTVDKKPAAIIKIITGFFVLILLITVALCIIGRNKIFTNISFDFTIAQLKNSLNQLNFYQRFLIQLPFILLIVMIFDLLLRRKKDFRFIVLVSIIDLFMATQFNMPVTVIGAKNFIDVEHTINRNPLQFPLPDNNSVEQNSVNSFDSLNLTGSKIPFEKKIGRNDFDITPGNLSLQDSFYNSPIRERVFKNRVLYFSDVWLLNISLLDSIRTNAFIIADPHQYNCCTNIDYTNNKGATIRITQFSGNEIKADIDNASGSDIVFLQNYYPGWKAFIDEKQVPVKKANITFMRVYTPAGKHTLAFSYDPTLIKYSWYLSLITLITIFIFLLFFRNRNSFFLGQQ